MTPPIAYFGTPLNVQSAAIAEKFKKLRDEIERIEQANREHRKIKDPGYPAQKVLSPQPARADSAGDQGAAESTINPTLM
jgi:hypothetical protein